MRNEYEKPFGDALHQIVGHLIKHAVPVPPAVLEGALAFENFTWADLPDEDKRSRIARIAEQTEPPSDIQRHFEGYPHHFSKDQYGIYLSALKYYKESLGL